MHALTNPSVMKIGSVPVGRLRILITTGIMQTAVHDIVTDTRDAGWRRELGVTYLRTGLSCAERSRVAAIKQAGGITIAEDPDEATSLGMPRSAIASGHIDHLLPLRDLPLLLTALVAEDAAIAHAHQGHDPETRRTALKSKPWVCRRYSSRRSKPFNSACDIVANRPKPRTAWRPLEVAR